MRISKRAATAAALTIAVGAPIAFTAPTAVADDQQPSAYSRISTAKDGGQADAASGTASVSRDGRTVLFKSGAGNIETGTPTTGLPWFVKNLTDGTVKRLVIPGVPAGADIEAKLSGDGRHVLLEGRVGADTGHFVHRLGSTAAPERVDTGIPDGYQGATLSGFVISANGRYVAFSAAYPPEPTKDEGGRIYVRDLRTNVTERVSHDRPDWQPRAAIKPSISDNGRFVAYEYDYTNGPRGDDWGQVYVRDRETGTLTRADVSHDGTPMKRESLDPVISGNGRYVAFESADDHIVPGDDDKSWNVFVRDLRTGSAVRVQSDHGGEADFYTRRPEAISPDGRYVTYRTWKDGGLRVRDVRGDSPSRLLIPATLQGEVQGNITSAAFTKDGSVVFSSAATDLVPGDTNGVDDVFRLRLR
ncbi:TolB family protein [Streptomyces sp. NPDC050418]|uniref:TolB family protein n=1 Tax=Streptomyces sp. NPDC050418 TaxID=3365612 RepID=UPI0037B2F8BD